MSVTRPFDSSPALYCKRSIVTMRLSCIDTETWRLKDNGVTSLTFWGHVTSLFTWAFDSREPSSYGWSIETGRPTKLFTSGHVRHFVSNIEFSGCTNVYHRIFNFTKEYLIFWPPSFKRKNHHPWLKSTAWSSWGCTSQSPWCIVESLPALLEKSKCYLLWKVVTREVRTGWSPECDKDKEGVEVRNEKMCPPYTRLGPLGLPTHIKLAPPLEMKLVDTNVTITSISLTLVSPSRMTISRLRTSRRRALSRDTWIRNTSVGKELTPSLRQKTNSSEAATCESASKPMLCSYRTRPSSTSCCVKFWPLSNCK